MTTMKNSSELFYSATMFSPLALELNPDILKWAREAVLDKLAIHAQLGRPSVSVRRIEGPGGDALLRVLATVRVPRIRPGTSHHVS